MALYNERVEHNLLISQACFNSFDTLALALVPQQTQVFPFKEGRIDAEKLP